MKELGIYIHIPFCIRKCNYCNFYSVQYKTELVERYISSISKEISSFTGSSDYYVSSMYLGGGTPSLLELAQLYPIFALISEKFYINENCELTIEANPKTVSAQKTKDWHILGINRVSLGVQSFNNDELFVLGRLHKAKHVYSAYESIIKNTTDNISFDLIYGIPEQTTDKWVNSLKKAIELKPKHISTYCLSIEKGTPFYDKRNELHLPSASQQRKMYYLGLSLLESSSYQQYELSNFSKPGFSAKHNVACWEGKEYIGFGASAHSFYQNKRWANFSDIHQYILYIQNQKKPREFENKIAQREYITDRIFLGLRLIKGINMAEFKKQYNFDIQEEYKDVLRKYQKENLLIIEDNFLRLARKAYFVSDEILSEFV